jgi:Primase X
MVDLDLKDFADERKKGKAALDRVLISTLKSIKESIGGTPTVLWTGNGYHVYQPVSGFILEEYETFYEFTKYVDKDLTSIFIQFAEEFFTNYAADRLHNPTVKSCLVRIPGSLNSKCTERGQDAEIKIIQKWDESRPSIQPMLREFRRWLIQKRIDDVEELKKQEKKHSKFQMTVYKNQQPINTIKWIEKGVLEHPLSDHRKYIVWRILSPYLLNVKKLPKEEAYSVMKEWLDKCDKLEKLSFDPKTKIKDGLKGASKGYFPISLEKLKEENRQLYDLILDRLGNSK